MLQKGAKRELRSCEITCTEHVQQGKKALRQWGAFELMLDVTEFPSDSSKSHNMFRTTGKKRGAAQTNIKEHSNRCYQACDKNIDKGKIKHVMGFLDAY